MSFYNYNHSEDILPEVCHDLDIFLDMVKSGIIKKFTNGKLITLKSGIKSDLYIDCRALLSNSSLLNNISLVMSKAISQVVGRDDIVLCGVPQGAVPLATLVSNQMVSPMIYLRDKPKAHGLQKLVEGYDLEKNGCKELVLIDDVFTTGSSVIETVNKLEKEISNLPKVIHVFVLFNRKDHVYDTSTQTSSGTEIKFHFLYSLCDIYGVRQLYSVKERLDKFMSLKSSKLCISLDYPELTDVVRFINNNSEHITNHVIAVKLHTDFYQQTHKELYNYIKLMSVLCNFIIIDDRKFCDIGMTVQLQYNKVTQYIADAVTVHAIAGPGTIQALTTMNPGLGIIVVTDLSTQKDLGYKDSYVYTAISQSLPFPNLIGFVTQNSKFVKKTCLESLKDTTISQIMKHNLLCFQPGISFSATEDDLDQKYTHPESAIKNCTDILIVGRDITGESKEIENKIKMYAKL